MVKKEALILSQKKKVEIICLVPFLAEHFYILLLMPEIKPLLLVDIITAKNIHSKKLLGLLFLNDIFWPKNQISQFFMFH